MHKNIFSYGDCCQTKLNEEKSLVSIFQFIHVVAHNIEQVARDSVEFLSIPPEVHTIQMLPMGNKIPGFFAFNKMVARNKDTGKDHGASAARWPDLLGGDPKALEDQAKMGKQFGSIMGVASGCCYCLPMHISKHRPTLASRATSDKEAFDKAY